MAENVVEIPVIRTLHGAAAKIGLLAQIAQAVGGCQPDFAAAAAGRVNEPVDKYEDRQC